MWLRSLIISMLVFASGSLATAQNRYASIIVDADNLDIIHARAVDEPRFPASLTKVMTLYLTFDALEAGQLQIDERVTVSRKAARTPPVELGLKTGETISIRDLIQSVAVRSHNDSAVVLAERLGGTTDGFAEMMNAKAAALGMSRTTFRNPNGLPNTEQLTTARDMAKLASAMLNTHSKYYHYFSQTDFRGKGTTNRLLGTVDGVDGFKTGYTRASGYNLIISATRDGRRLIAVVLGGASGDSRNRHMRDLIERGFTVMDNSTRPDIRIQDIRTSDVRNPSNRNNETPAPRADAPPVILALRDGRGQTARIQTAGAAITPPRSGKWTVEYRNLPSEAAARALVTGDAVKGRGQIGSGFANGTPVFHARVTELSARDAKAACAAPHGAERCLLISP